MYHHRGCTLILSANFLSLQLSQYKVQNICMITQQSLIQLLDIWKKIGAEIAFHSEIFYVK